MLALARTVWPVLASGLLALGLPAVLQAQGAGREGVVVTKWAEGLGGPQGLARASNGEILVAEHDTGKVSRFDTAGKKLGVLSEGLLSPSWALFHEGALYVSERKGNSVARIADGKLSRLPGEVVDPLGIIRDPKNPRALLVLSHRESVVRRFLPESAAGSFKLDAEPVVTPKGGTKYGWRDLAFGKDGTLYVTDEVSRAILRRKPGGELTEWSTNLASPSGLAFDNQGRLYVTEEGNGRVSRVADDGSVTVLAEGMGAARAILFLDNRTMLISDRRGGAVWKVTLQ
jgi:glucose/arabinose dehydrogenase